MSSLNPDTCDPRKLAAALRRECEKQSDNPYWLHYAGVCSALLAVLDSLGWYLTEKNLNEDGINIRDNDITPAIRAAARAWLAHGGTLEGDE